MLAGFILPSILIEDFFNLNPTQENPISKIDNNYFIFFMIAVLVPVFETLIFQIAIIKGCQIVLTLFWEKLNEHLVLLSSIGFQPSFLALVTFTILYML
jgi:hypothetical protein